MTIEVATTRNLVSARQEAVRWHIGKEGVSVMFRFDVRDGGKGTNGGGELRGWDDDDSLAGEDGEDTTRERSLWEAELAAVWEAEADGRGGWWIGEDKAQAELPARW